MRGYLTDIYELRKLIFSSSTESIPELALPNWEE